MRLYDIVAKILWIRVSVSQLPICVQGYLTAVVNGRGMFITIFRYTEFYETNLSRSKKF